ncbi:S-adenosyl-L-methionine:benzoic acid/salicylic acid carboxyl methyltransferase 1 [Euphorbia peplus]|nr:S-adenosyl-L-methionine:benzoic acid/salicylic acid carboxyl methyltransferase 1 [Euphorbia peplus]
MGCSSGPTSLLPLLEIMEVIDSALKITKPPMIEYFLNDLPGNDYNTVFASLVPEFQEKLEKEKVAQFGDDINLDDLFRRYSFKLADCLEQGTGVCNYGVTSMIKK